jgi:hypothetical protein
MIRLVPWLLVIALTVYALVDCLQSDEDAVRGVPRLLWALLILVLPLMGPIAWFVAGRPEQPRRGAGPRQQPRRPRGPDDDPDFLRRL